MMSQLFTNPKTKMTMENHSFQQEIHLQIVDFALPGNIDWLFNQPSIFPKRRFWHESKLQRVFPPENLQKPWHRLETQMGFVDLEFFDSNDSNLGFVFLGNSFYGWYHGMHHH